ncbi:ABC transporter ATP-binding protein [Tepidanaerobacter syntrophicus]|uniref:Oligopeptide transport system ATP-binding protein n=1 Tax=Tepidanaerobacter syntrophicus TaxID=224999 RepID=A0A0U9HL97_9FIRM|nr:dipeptide ABC transporter ATP-binding protein [Tepidanaerobacter syntrophicus]GAQ24593.1 oligopeptide transport system ATP-binding protein [Tepidanaerobacter syntrophicus]GLI19831.1 ABC transporter ATP-binding protein [Tepidanaerobacter syntrophicus]
MDDNIILEVKDLKKYYPVETGIFGAAPVYLKAVDGVSFNVEKGKTLGIIGESGCGKSTVAKLLMNLERPTAGSIKFKGRDTANFNESEMKKLRKNMQMVFQDPYSSLDPKKTAGYIIQEPLIIHNVGTRAQQEQRVKELLKMVGLDYYHANRYPHEFSGGQRQRINIARAIALNPEIVICDEPVSALDVSIQAQVINLLKRLQEELGLAYIFISHDLSVVKYLSDKLAIMYLGKIVETGKSDDIYKNPMHPYTKALFSAIPPESPLEEKEKMILEGDVPSPLKPPSGCKFHTRCPYAMEKCSKEEPSLKQIGDGQQVSCHLY